MVVHSEGRNRRIEFEASLYYIATSYLKIKTKTVK
jgi:hypothetical protein